MMATSSAALLIACLSFMSYDDFTFRQNVADRLNILADITGANVAAAITYHDPRSAIRILQALHGEPHIQTARVYRIDGSAFASYLRSSPSEAAPLPAQLPQVGTRLEPGRVTTCQPIIFDDEVVGYVYLDSDVRELELRRHRLVLFVLILIAVSSAAAFFVAVLLKRVIAAPILDLVQTTKRVSRQKNYGIRARRHASDEMGLLVDGFNEMLGEIEKRDADLKNEVAYRVRAEQTLRENQVQLQLLLDSTAEAIYGMDIRGVCTFSNQACLRILGYESSDELLGQHMHDLIHHSRPDGTPYPLAECPSYRTMISGRQGHTDQDLLWRKDGTGFPVEAWSHPVLMDGKLMGVVVTFVDITERQLSQNELRAAHAESELFINSVPSILIGLDAESRIIRWNLAAANAFALKDTDVLGKFLATCGIRWLLSDVEGAISAMLFAESPTKWEDVLFEKDGEQRLLGLTVTKIRLSDTEDVNFLIVGADITERRRAEGELRSKTAFLEAQTNATLDGILVVDGQGDKILQNRRFVEMFRIPEWIRDEKNEKSLNEFVLSEVKDAEILTQSMQYLYSHANETSFDEVEMKNGMVVDRYSSPVIGKDGTHYGRIWIFRDITQRKRNEDAVRQLSLAVEQSPVSVLITDLQGSIIYVNQHFRELTGYRMEEVVGGNPRILNSGNTLTAEYKQMWETITQGKEWRGEFRNKKKSGELYWASVVISPIKDNSGKPTHFLAFQEDVTEQRNRESQLRQAQKLEAIGQLAAGIAHEINTPIQFIGDNTRFVKESWRSLDPALSLLQSLSNAVAGKAVPSECPGQLNDILEGVDTEYLRQEIPQALDQSLEGIARVAKIVQAMKEFSHPGSDEKQLADINKVILTTLTVARNEWKYVAEVETLLAVDLEFVPCHVSEFSQVILNLLINSAHAIAEVVGDAAKGKGKITVRTIREPDWVEISIQDTGVGIPAQIRSRIFEPFFTTKGVGKGTGQGLALAHATIVKKHGGRLWFESEVGSGTTFHIQLPVAKRTT
jgi:PAS domain S-box-containing protein